MYSILKGFASVKNVSTAAKFVALLLSDRSDVLCQPFLGIKTGCKWHDVANSAVALHLMNNFPLLFPERRFIGDNSRPRTNLLPETRGSSSLCST